MKIYFLGLSLVLLILTCTKPQEEANINDQTNEPICYTGETEIFQKDFIKIKVNICFKKIKLRKY